MAYLSLVADIIGVIGGVYVFIIGAKDHFKKPKRKPDEDDNDRNQGERDDTTKAEE